MCVYICIIHVLFYFILVGDGLIMQTSSMCTTIQSLKLCIKTYISLLLKEKRKSENGGRSGDTGGIG